jgi:hypothetical protein
VDCARIPPDGRDTRLVEPEERVDRLERLIDAFGTPSKPTPKRRVRTTSAAVPSASLMKARRELLGQAERRPSRRR